jgi:hypothetical protein
VRNHLGRVLDLVMASDPSMSVSSSLDMLVQMDDYHPVLEICIRACSPLEMDETSNTYNFSRADYSSLSQYLFGIDWSFLEGGGGSFNERVTEFNNVIIEGMEKFVPKTRGRGHEGRYPRWFSKELINLISEKTMAHRKFKRTACPVDYECFSELRRQCKRLYESCHSDYVKSVEASLAVNTKGIFKYTNALKANEVDLPGTMFYGQSTSHDISGTLELFTKFFSETYDDAEIQSVICDGEFVPIDSINIQQFRIEIHEIAAYIRGLEPKRTSGPDGIPPVLIKNCSRSLYYPLYLLFNESVSTGSFPDLWKSSYITPIFKSGDRSDISNYRPVCILSCFPKMFEKLVLSKISTDLYRIIMPYQHGFMPLRSTQTNLVIYEDYISRALSERKQVDALYTDLSKAFDRVPHNVLIDKLFKLGINGQMISWLGSYLTGRSLVVRIGGRCSRAFHATSGVPQGSHMGPVLFILFINDVVQVFNDVNFLVFADDVKIYNTVTSENDCRNLQRGLNNFGVWCARNGLSVNIKKCSIVRFHRKKNPLIFQYSFLGSDLESLSEVKDLGIIFDQKLSFISHINSIVNKSMRVLGFIVRITRDFLNIDTMRLLYLSLVRSILEYGSVVWSPFYNVHIKQLERTQHKFLRYINFRMGFTMQELDYDYLLYLLNIHSLVERRSLADLSFLHKLIHNDIDAPDILQSINFFAPNRLTRQAVPFYPSNSNTNHFYYSPLNRMQRLGNEFAEISDIFHSSLSAYKSSLVAHLNMPRILKYNNCLGEDS